jgi:FemAB-related protein (PEP-CTERM system-associated)
VSLPAIASANGMICEYEDPFRSVWDDYVLHHLFGTPFHLIAWKRVVERSFGLKARYLLAECDGRVRGVLPMFLAVNPLQGRTLISSPFAVYGGPIADDEETATFLRSEACRIGTEQSVQYVEFREPRPVNAPGFHTKNLYVSFDQELPEDEEMLLKGFPRDTRYMIRKAQKNGLRSERRQGRFDLDIFYQIYARSFHHLGTPVFSRHLFRVIQEEFGDSCELTTVWQGANALASVFSFRFRHSILPYFGGSLLEGRQVAANNFMYFEVMKRAINDGLRNFDFGRSKAGSGSYAFKTQWNMRERPLPYQFYLIRRSNLPDFSPANPRFKLFISSWKAMPFAVTKVLGPAVVRLFP